MSTDTDVKTTLLILGEGDADPSDPVEIKGELSDEEGELSQVVLREDNLEGRFIGWAGRLLLVVDDQTVTRKKEEEGEGEEEKERGLLCTEAGDITPELENEEAVLVAEEIEQDPFHESITKVLGDDDLIRDDYDTILAAAILARTKVPQGRLEGIIKALDDATKEQGVSSERNANFYPAYLALKVRLIQEEQEETKAS